MYDKLIKITQYKYPQNFVEIFINDKWLHKIQNVHGADAHFTLPA